MMAMRGRWAEAVELFMAVSWLRVGSGGQGVIGRRCGRCGLGRCCDQRRGDRPGIEWARSGDGAAGRRTDDAGVRDIGTATWRDRVCKYVWNRVVDEA